MSAVTNNNRRLKPIAADRERLKRLFASACILHAGPRLWNKLSHQLQQFNERPIEYWQREVDDILLKWTTAELCHRSAIHRISSLKRQLRESQSTASISRQSIDAMLNSAWELVNTMHFEEKKKEPNQNRTPLLRIVGDPP